MSPPAESPMAAAPADAAAAAAPAAGQADGTAPEAGADAVGAKVMRFLRDVRGLSAIPSEDLDALLYECRFELLPPPKIGRGGGGDGSGASPGRKGCRLPLFTNIPTQEELHDLLIGGSLPGAHQCVAHMLYPDFVPWPPGPGAHRRGSSSSSSASGCAPPPGAGVADDAQSSGAEAASGASAEAASPGGGAGTGSLSLRNAPSLGSLARTPVSQRSQERSVPELDASHLPMQRFVSLATQEESLEDPGESAVAEITIRGQKVTTTALGRQFQDAAKEKAVSSEEELDDSAYKAARERKQKQEHAVKIECYEEKKLLERIECLEAMKRAELEHREALQKREAKRRARKEFLQKQLEVDYNRKFEEEKAKQELEEQKRKKEADAEQRTKRYHEKQKELLAQWHAETCDEYLSREAQAKLRHAELLAQKKAQELEKQSQKKTMKQLETLQKLHRIQTAAEERPPLPPKPHDLPRPVLETLGDLLDGGPATARSGSQSARGGASEKAGWAAQARAVSNMYGLSEKERAAVQDQLSRGVRGAGRMAAYERQG